VSLLWTSYQLDVLRYWTFSADVFKRFLGIMVKSSPVTGLEWPRGFQEVEVPRFLDNGTVWW
jgi:hypothetical protein